MLHLLRLRGQRRAVDADARPLDRDQDRHERQFDRRVDKVELLPGDEVADHRRQLTDQVGALAGEVESGFDRQIRQRERLRAAPADVLFGQRLVARVLERQLLETMLGAGRIEEIAGEHRVGAEPPQRDAVPRQHDRVELQVVAVLADRLVLEHRAERVQRGRERHAGGVADGLMADRHIVGILRGGRKRQPDNRRAHRRRSIRQDAQPEVPGGPQSVCQLPHSLVGVDDAVVLGDGLRGRRVFLGEPPEPELVEDPEAALA